MTRSRTTLAPLALRGARAAVRFALLTVVAAGFPVGLAFGGTPRIDAHPPAPPFRIESLDHRPLDLEKLTARGPVLLDFWATWCKPCVAALLELESLQRRFGADGLTVIGVSIDGPRNFARVRPFVAKLGVTLPIVLDEDGRLQQQYQVRVMPTSFLIDRTGAIALTRVGYERGDSEPLERAIRALLPAAADSSIGAPSNGTHPAR